MRGRPVSSARSAPPSRRPSPAASTLLACNRLAGASKPPPGGAHGRPVSLRRPEPGPLSQAVVSLLPVAGLKPPRHGCFLLQRKASAAGSGSSQRPSSFPARSRRLRPCRPARRSSAPSPANLCFHSFEQECSSKSRVASVREEDDGIDSRVDCVATTSVRRVGSKAQVCALRVSLLHRMGRGPW